MKAKEVDIPKTISIVKHFAQKSLPLKLELGSGAGVKPGWIGLDLSPKATVQCDILEVGIPFPDSSVHIVYSEHFLEHFYFWERDAILQECRRVLKAGGVFSVAVPDASLYIKGYLDRIFPDCGLAPYLPAYDYNSPIDAVNYIAYMAGEHKHMFDMDNLIQVLIRAGFDSVRERAFDPALDSEHRQGQSIYAEAINP